MSDDLIRMLTQSDTDDIDVLLLGENKEDVSKLISVFGKYHADKNYQNRPAIMDNQLVDIGDRVIMKMEDESRLRLTVKKMEEDSWVSLGNEIANGTYGTIVGFVKSLYTVNRNHQMDGLIKGTYLNFDGQPIVQWDNGVTQNASIQDLVFADSALLLYRSKLQKIEPNKKRVSICVGNLPSSKYYEGDLVRFYWKDNLIKKVEGRILNIEYDFSKNIDNILEEDFSHLFPEIYYTIGINKDSFVTTRQVYIQDVVERGNHWNFENNCPLSFKTIVDETHFWYECGQVEKIIYKNPEGGRNLIGFTNDEIIEILQKGEADFMPEIFYSSDKTRSKFRILKFSRCLYKLVDKPLLSEKIREYSIAVLQLQNK